jgi:hypothetical protein
MQYNDAVRIDKRSKLHRKVSSLGVFALRPAEDISAKSN